MENAQATALFRGRTFNPDTGAEVIAIWARNSAGAPLKVINSEQELKAYGSPADVLKALKPVKTQYGNWMFRLPNVEAVEELTW